MPFLLDTHAFVWAVSDRHMLSARVSDLLNDETSRIFVSPVSAYELIYKFGGGKWTGVADIAEDFAGMPSRADFAELPVTSQL